MRDLHRDVWKCHRPGCRAELVTWRLNCSRLSWMWVLRKHFSMLWCWCCQSQLGGWGSRLIWCDLIYSSAAGRNGANTTVRIFHHLPAHPSRDMVISPGAWVFSPGPLLSLSAQNQLLPSPCALLHPCRKLLSGQESSWQRCAERQAGGTGPFKFWMSALAELFPYFSVKEVFSLRAKCDWGAPGCCKAPCWLCSSGEMVMEHWEGSALPSKGTARLCSSSSHPDNISYFKNKSADKNFCISALIYVLPILQTQSLGESQKCVDRTAVIWKEAGN